MSSAAFPSVVSAVLATIDAALPAVRTIRGANISGETGDVVMIGKQTPDFGFDSAGSFRQTMQTFGGNREEVGEVNGLIFARNGDNDQDDACSTAFGYLAAVEAAVRADPTLGLTSFDFVVAEMSSGDVSESQDNDGAVTVVTFLISYKIRI